MDLIYIISALINLAVAIFCHQKLTFSNKVISVLVAHMSANGIEPPTDEEIEQYFEKLGIEK